MKNNYLTYRKLAVAAFVTLLGANLVFAEKVSSLDLTKKELRAVPAAEMPAQAAKLVSQAKADVAEATAENVVAAAVAVRPAAIVSVVSAIARQNPELAPAAAGKAASLKPKEVTNLARAAVGAAPAQAAKIAYALCKAAPTQYASIATAIANTVPSATKDVLASIYAALPALQPFVDRAASQGQDLSVASVMKRTEALIQTTAQSAKVTPAVVVSSTPPAYLPPPTPAGPFTPYTSSTELNRTNVVEIPTGGGRNYSGP